MRENMPGNWLVSLASGYCFKLLFRPLSIADIEETASRIVGRPAKIVLDAPAEMAMDVDKPGQLELLRADYKAQND